MLDFLDVFACSPASRRAGSGVANSMARLLGLTLIAVFFVLTVAVLS